MSLYPRLVIYYFSGTGNSRNVAAWLSELASQHHIDSTIINIALSERLSTNPPPSDALVIFVSPVHGFNYPPVMLHFIARFPKGKNKVVLMNTRAGMLIGNYNLPGISGLTFLLSSTILKIKGYSLAGFVPVDLPSNWISLHPGLNDRTIKILHEKNKLKVAKSAEKLFSGSKPNISIFEKVIDLLISPISLGYYFAGRFMFSKTFYASSECNNCDLCIKNCPVKAIIKIDKRPFWTLKCESCMNCMSHCPKNAIETAHGFIISYIILSSGLTGLILEFIGKYLIIENGIVHFVLNTLLFLIFLTISYRLIHYLMRFKFVERMMVYTSLTKYKFWGKRYKALKNF